MYLAGMHITRNPLFIRTGSTQIPYNKVCLDHCRDQWFSRGGTSIKVDPIAYVQQFPNATIQDPDLLIDAVIRQLLPVDLAATFKTETKIQTLLGGQVTNNYWTTAWDNYTGTPTNTSYTNIVKTRINSLLTTLLQLAEYQLM